MSQKYQKMKRNVYKKTIGAFCEREIAVTLERKLKRQKIAIFILSIVLAVVLTGGAILLCLILN